MSVDQLSPDAFAALLDRYGANLADWPDRASADVARRSIMASPAHRQRYEEARRLERLMGRHAAALDAAAVREGIVQRAGAATMQALPPRRRTLRRSAAPLAAGLMLAVLMGGAFERLILRGPDEGVEIVMLDTLLFGPGEVEFQ